MSLLAVWCARFPETNSIRIDPTKEASDETRFLARFSRSWIVDRDESSR